MSQQEIELAELLEQVEYRALARERGISVEEVAQIREAEQQQETQRRDRLTLAQLDAEDRRRSAEADELMAQAEAKLDARRAEIIAARTQSGGP